MKMPSRAAIVSLLAAAFLGLLAGLAADRFAQPATADVERGSEDAFVRGLHERERSQGKPLRWTTERAVATFVHLPPGPATLEVVMQSHRAPLRVAVGGLVAGTVRTGERDAHFPVVVGPSRSLEVTIAAEGFAAGGRVLGTQWRRVTVVSAVRAWPTAGLLALFVLPALLMTGGALWAGMRPMPALLVTVLLVAVEALLLVPFGLLRSAYAQELAGLMAVSACLAGVVGRLAVRWRGDAGPWGVVACVTAFVVHCILATSPVMVVSDAVMQSHILDQVAGGEMFPTSVTQHATPFRIPYGISFFALLAPFRLMGLDALALVRWGAGLAGLVASLALFALLAGESPRRAAWTVLALEILPGTFLVYSQGNLPNAFAQAMTVLFFVWWAGSARGGWPIGALLFALGTLGHLSSAITLGVLASALLAASWRDCRETGSRRLLALAAGMALTALYYGRFLSLVTGQLHRLTEGAGQGGGQPWTTVALLQLRWMAWDWWGFPALLLAVLGLTRPHEGRLDRALAAFWLAGAALFVAALVSPVEVRYLYALTLPLSFAVASGYAWLASKGQALRALGLTVLLGQAALAIATLTERIFMHYR